MAVIICALPPISAVNAGEEPHPTQIRIQLQTHNNDSTYIIIYDQRVLHQANDQIILIPNRIAITCYNGCEGTLP